MNRSGQLKHSGDSIQESTRLSQEHWGPVGLWNQPPAKTWINPGPSLPALYGTSPGSEHEITDDDDLNSGNYLVFSGYSPSGSLTQPGQSEIVNQICQLKDVEPEVVNRAIQIYHDTMRRIQTSEASSTVAQKPARMRSIKGSRKNQLIFYCVFMAYIDLNAALDPCRVAEIIHISSSDIDQALSEFLPPGANLIEPEKFVSFYVRTVNELIEDSGQSLAPIVVEKVCEVIKICRSTRGGQEWILNTSSKIVAITALYFYLNDIMGSSISRDTSLFERASHMSWACIRRYHREIATYYNYSDEYTAAPKMDWLTG